jgi:hypothetical protein
MFNKRLLSEFKENKILVVGMVITQWLSLLANVLLIYFLYIEVLINHLWNFSDPLAYKNAERRKNGVVGSIGRTIPIIPITIEIQPAMMHI